MKKNHTGSPEQVRKKESFLSQRRNSEPFASLPLDYFKNKITQLPREVLRYFANHKRTEDFELVQIDNSKGEAQESSMNSSLEKNENSNVKAQGSSKNPSLEKIVDRRINGLKIRKSNSMLETLFQKQFPGLESLAYVEPDSQLAEFLKKRDKFLAENGLPVRYSDGSTFKSNLSNNIILSCAIPVVKEDTMFVSQNFRFLSKSMDTLSKSMDNLNNDSKDEQPQPQIARPSKSLDTVENEKKEVSALKLNNNQFSLYVIVIVKQDDQFYLQARVLPGAVVSGHPGMLLKSENFQFPSQTDDCQKDHSDSKKPTPQQNQNFIVLAGGEIYTNESGKIVMVNDKTGAFHKSIAAKYYLNENGDIVALEDTTNNTIPIGKDPSGLESTTIDYKKIVDQVFSGAYAPTIKKDEVFYKMSREFSNDEIAAARVNGEDEKTLLGIMRDIAYYAELKRRGIPEKLHPPKLPAHNRYEELLKQKSSSVMTPGTMFSQTGSSASEETFVTNRQARP